MSRKPIPLPITSIDYKAAVQFPAILNLTERDSTLNLITVLYTQSQMLLTESDISSMGILDGY